MFNPHQQRSCYELKDLVNNSSFLSIGFKTGILFSPEMLDLYRYIPYIYAVLKRLAKPSDYHIPLPDTILDEITRKPNI